jgi:hypothetical protein
LGAVAAVIITVVVAGAGLLAWTVGVRGSIKAVEEAVGFRILDADVTLEARPAEIGIGESAIFTATVDGKPAARLYRCEWTIGADAAGGDDCLPRLQRGDPLALPSGLARAEIPVTVEVWTIGGSRLGAAQASFAVVPRLKAAIEADSYDLFVNQDLEVRAQPEGGLDPSLFRCEWTTSLGAITAVDAGGCIARLRVDAPLPGGKPRETAELTVVVRGTGGDKLGEAKRGISVSTPRENHYVFVLDASSRAGQKLGTKTIFDESIGTIASRLDLLKASGAFSGIHGFGALEDKGKKAADPCKAVRAVYPHQPLNAEDADEALRGVKTGDEAKAFPVLAAIRQGVEAAARVNDPDARIFLLTLVAGPDTCETQDAAAFLARLRATLTGGAAERLIIEYRMLPLALVVAFTETDRRRFEDVLRASDGGPSNDRRGPKPLVVTDREVFAQLLDALARMGGDKAAASRGCAEINGPLDRAGADKATFDYVKEFCTRLQR